MISGHAGIGHVVHLLAVLSVSMVAVFLMASPSYSAGEPGTQKVSPASDVTRFLELYSSVYRRLYTVGSEASWDASTDVTPEHDGARVAANKALSVFAGDPAVIREVRGFLAKPQPLRDLERRQLDRIMLLAAESPGTIPDIVAKRVEAESKQSSILDSFEFCMEKGPSGCARPITANQIDTALRTSRDLAERR